MGDIVGRLFREFAITLSVTILVSAVVSLTLTPMMCAKLLRHRAGARGRAASTAGPSAVFERIIAATARRSLGARPPAGDAGGGGRHPRRSPSLLYVVVPKGFFPSRTRASSSASRRRRSVSFPAMAERQQALARVDPAGPRGGEPVVVHRRRRHQHDAQQRPHPDQPQAARGARRRARARSSGACSRALAEVDGITLYMQPVQDLTRRGPREPHAVPVQPRGRRPASWPAGRRAWSTALRSAAELRDVASDQQNEGLAGHAGDRPRHRLAPRHHAAAIDDTLYDAFGQRQVSTMFTQLNQYRVVLEVRPEFQQDPTALHARSTCARRPAARCRSSTFTHVRDRRPRRSPSTTRASSRRSRSRSTWRPAPRSAKRSTPIDASRARARHAGEHRRPASRARRRPSRPRSPTSPS